MSKLFGEAPDFEHWGAEGGEVFQVLSDRKPEVTMGLDLGREPSRSVWVVCTLLEGEKAGQFEVQGVYDTREQALEACTDDLTSAARFEVGRDYRGHYEFEVVSKVNPEPALTTSPSQTRKPASSASCVLRVAGLSYPRTCQVCGLGPCRIGAPSDFEPAP